MAGSTGARNPAIFWQTEPPFWSASVTAQAAIKAARGWTGVYLHTGRLYVPVLAEDGKVRAFQEVRPENYLAAAEMSAEGNYNQIDGIINNEPPPKPSVLDALSQCRQDAARDHDTPKKPPRGQEVER